MKSEQEFLQKLQNRAREQEILLTHVPFPKTFKVISIWFGNHPWRLMIPFSLIVSFALHYYFGKQYDDLILKIFGGFGIIRL